VVRAGNVIATAQQLENYLDSFSAFEKAAAGYDQPWLRNLRQEAFTRFCQVGFPTTREEDWRFTNVQAIAQTPFRLAREVRVSGADIIGAVLAGAASRLVFVNGRFAPELSSLDNLPHGLRVNALAKEITANSPIVEAHLGRYANIQRDAFCALNTAFMEDGAFVHLRRGVVIEQPIHVLLVSTATEKPSMNHPRNLFFIEEGSQLAVVEEYISLGAASRSLCNAVTELVVQQGSVVSHYMIEREHEEAFNISTLRLEQGRNANVASHSLLLGGGLVRNNVHPVLAGEGAECLINGLFIGKNVQHLDNYMLVEHASPHCSSRQFYNGILDDRAHGVFHGRIIVHKDAQKTDAKQTNRNLLLSDDAQIDTKPQLEIYADDVKCTHGATIGQIEEDALFYLRSRGMDETSARKLLLLAFARECLERMKEDSVRCRIEELVQKHHFRIAATGSSNASGSDGARNWEEAG